MRVPGHHLTALPLGKLHLSTFQSYEISSSATGKRGPKHCRAKAYIMQEKETQKLRNGWELPLVCYHILDPCFLLDSFLLSHPTPGTTMSSKDTRSPVTSSWCQWLEAKRQNCRSPGSSEREHRNSQNPPTQSGHRREPGQRQGGGGCTGLGGRGAEWVGSKEFKGHMGKIS